MRLRFEITFKNCVLLVPTAVHPEFLQNPSLLSDDLMMTLCFLCPDGSSVGKLPCYLSILRYPSSSPKLYFVFQMADPCSIYSCYLIGEEEEDFTETPRSVVWELIPLFGPWSRRGLNPIKPVYDPDRPDGQLSWLNYLIGDLG